MTALQRRLGALGPAELRGILRGIEKEGLRTTPAGALALTPHPAALGSPLTHPSITTDFSESQLELITAAHPDVGALAAELTEIHQFVHRNLQDELVWASSMPCELPDEATIPLGRYGTSNIGRAKTVYRTGLSYRYGRRMQTISGIHYNFSLPDSAWPILAGVDADARELRSYRDAAYFALIRNFRRRSWLLLYLFGASPAVARSFVEGRPHALQPLGTDSLHLPYSTSLRMGPLGYQSDAQAALAVSYNCLETYAASLNRGLTAPYPPYEAIGLREGDDYRQLSTTLLQIENEFYGTIRPKRRIRSGERPLRAMIERGVEYVEVRCMDLDPFCPIGITTDTMRFLDVFLLHCALTESPPDTPQEIARNAGNQHRTAERGREPGFAIDCADGSTTLEVGARAMLDECVPIADALDAAHGGDGYRAALAMALARVRDPASTPSASVLAAMASNASDSHCAFALACSAEHRETLLAMPLDPATRDRHVALAAASHGEQRDIEAADHLPFETWRQQYVDQDLLGSAPSARAG